MSDDALHTEFSLSVVTASKGNATKRLIVGPDGLPVADPNHKLGIWSGTLERRTVYGLCGLRELIVSLNTKQAMVHGVPRHDGNRFKLVVSKRYQGELGTIARTQECIAYTGDINLVMFDYDPYPDSRVSVNSAEELIAHLANVWPAVSGAGYLRTVSTSSAIKDKVSKEWLTPARGMHVYMLVRGNPALIKDALKPALWLAGYGYLRLATANQQTGVASILERSLVDMSVFSPERLDYCAGAIVKGAPFYQDRPAPEIHPGAILDLTTLPILSDSDRAEYQRQIAERKAALVPERRERVRARVKEQYPDIPNEDVEREIDGRLSSAERGELAPDHLLFFANGTTCKAIGLSQKLDGERLADPLEPEYRNGDDAIFHWNGGRWLINSWAHGNLTTYRLLGPSAPEPDADDTDDLMQRIDDTHNGIPLSDTYNAARLVEAYGDRLHYVGEWQKILVYEDGVWRIDYQLKSFQYAKEIAMQLVDEARKQLAAAGSNKEAREEALYIFDHAKASLSTAKIHAMLTNASAAPPLPISHQCLNPMKDMLPVDNGVVMLRTGEFVSHDPAYLFTAKMSVTYDPNATCPLWERTLHVIFGGSTEVDSPEDSRATLEARFERDARAKRLVDCLQRIFGYALTAEVLTHALFLFVGVGRNGKSLIINAMLKMFGDLGCVVNQSLFMESKSDRHPTERATLFGKRLAVTSETSKNKRLNEAFVRAATTDDPVNARRMREDEWQFQPTHTLFIATNHRPVADPDDFALWERIWLIPFEQVFYDPDKLTAEELADPAILKQDKTLPARLLEEIPGILNWCIKGCVDYYRDGLLMPDEVKAATQDYRADENNVKRFTEDDGACWTKENPKPQLLDDVFNDSAKNLYARYALWCEENETSTVTPTTFGVRLRTLGFEQYKSNGRMRYRKILAKPVKNEDESTNNTAAVEG